MTTKIRERLEQISRLAEVNLDELSLGITQESRVLANLSEERRRALQELLGLLGWLDAAELDTLDTNDGSLSSDEGQNHREKEFPPQDIAVSADPDQHWLTVNQVSTILRVNPMTVRRWIRSGLISHVVLPGRSYRIGAADLACFISEHYQRAIPG